jgi:prevent-host-death family protein
MGFPVRIPAEVVRRRLMWFLRRAQRGHPVLILERGRPVARIEPLTRSQRAAARWEPFEISVVPVPVDRDAAVRAQGEQGLPAPAIEPALSDEDPPMPETTPAEPAAASPGTVMPRSLAIYETIGRRLAAQDLPR